MPIAAPQVEVRAEYHLTVREMPADERPRERLERYGAATLQTAELLAMILRVGSQGENAIALATRLLREFGGLGGLLAADMGELCKVRGLGPAKATELKAALEIGRRLSTLAPEQRPQIKGPDDIFTLLVLETDRLLKRYRLLGASGCRSQRP
jgi:DNA repair protein RadC